MSESHEEDRKRIVIPVTAEDIDACRVLWATSILKALREALSRSKYYPFSKRREDALNKPDWQHKR